MEYRFKYFFNRSESEQSMTIENENEKDAVLNFLDTLTQKFGLEKMRTIEFSCVISNGKFFTDDDKLEEKMLIQNGC